MATINGKLIHPESAKQQKLTKISEQIIHLKENSNQSLEASKKEIYLLNNLHTKINSFDNKNKQQIIALEKVFNRKIFPILTSTIIFTTFFSFLIFHTHKKSICEYQGYLSHYIENN